MVDLNRRLGGASGRFVGGSLALVSNPIARGFFEAPLPVAPPDETTAVVRMKGRERSRSAKLARRGPAR